MSNDHFRDHCGVVGIIDVHEAGNLAYLALSALQHRGQESAGIVSSIDGRFHRHVGMGLVADVFTGPILDTLIGNTAIGHVRYSTSGSAEGSLRDAQPLYVQCQNGTISIAHNGNIVNALELRSKLEKNGSIFQTSSDTEVICHLMARKQGDFLTRFRAALRELKGAFTLVAIGDGKLYGARDPHGVRPLVLGSLRRGHVLASETCAFNLIEAKLIREVKPGEIVIIGQGEIKSEWINNDSSIPAAQCIFEHVYFARPDSEVFGKVVQQTRKAMGKQLAIEAPANADLVVPVPDSGIYAAMGYAEQSSIPFEMALVRNHYIGRTFIEPEKRIRNFGVKLKLNPIHSLIKDKRVVLVDDSIVRGTTSAKIVECIRNAGAKEIHVRISAPPTINPCFYGIDTPNKEELIASSNSIEEVANYIKCDSLSFLSLEGLHKVVNQKQGGFCDACFSGKYPVPVPESHRKLVALSRKH